MLERQLPELKNINISFYRKIGGHIYNLTKNVKKLYFTGNYAFTVHTNALVCLKGMSHEIDFKSFDQTLKNLT
jgi:hypothetical protein